MRILIHGERVRKRERKNFMITTGVAVTAAAVAIVVVGVQTAAVEGGWVDVPGVVYRVGISSDPDLLIPRKYYGGQIILDILTVIPTPMQPLPPHHIRLRMTDISGYYLMNTINLCGSWVERMTYRSLICSHSISALTHIPVGMPGPRGVEIACISVCPDR